MQFGQNADNDKDNLKFKVNNIKVDNNILKNEVKLRSKRELLVFWLNGKMNKTEDKIKSKSTYWYWNPMKMDTRVVKKDDVYLKPHLLLEQSLLIMEALW